MTITHTERQHFLKSDPVTNSTSSFNSNTFAQGKMQCLLNTTLIPNTTKYGTNKTPPLHHPKLTHKKVIFDNTTVIITSTFNTSF